MKDKEKGYEGFGGLAEDFHYYSNEIYDRWDEGLKPKKVHMITLLQICKEFIKLNKHQSQVTISPRSTHSVQCINIYKEKLSSLIFYLERTNFTYNSPPRKFF